MNKWLKRLWKAKLAVIVTIYFIFELGQNLGWWHADKTNMVYVIVVIGIIIMLLYRVYDIIRKNRLVQT